METTESPPPLSPQDRMAKARAKSHQPLGLARRDLTWAEKAVERIERRYKEDIAAARVRLAKAQARVRHYEELEKIEAAAATDEAVTP